MEFARLATFIDVQFTRASGICLKALSLLVATCGCSDKALVTAVSGVGGASSATAGSGAVVNTGASGIGSTGGAVGASVGSDAGGADGTGVTAGASSGGPSNSGAGGAGASVGGSSNSGAGGAGASAGGSSNSDAGGSSNSSAGMAGERGVAGARDVPADFFARYEAESTLNVLTYPVERVATEGAPACAANGVKEGANCASGGEVVSQILGRSPCDPPTSTTSYTQCQNQGGGVTFKQVTVPTDGTYDVTFWYHCGPDTPGHADVYGDAKCGGLNYDTGPGTGCRPHLIDVNGAPISVTSNGKAAVYFQFPCYTAPWSVIHGATTALPLKAGANEIYIHAPGATTLDAADLDALDVQASGHGSAPAPLWPKLVTPVLLPN